MMRRRSDRYIYEGGTKRHPQWNHALNYPDNREGHQRWLKDGGDRGPVLSTFEIWWFIVFAVGWVTLWL